MYTGPDNRLAREEALKRVEKSDVLHSSGFVNNEGPTSGASSMTYKQRQEMIRKHIGSYDKSKLGAVRNPGQRALAMESGQSSKPQGSRFDAQIRRQVKK